jgi:aromatic ring-opening dioxygenase catalytic subunit (LigB family)
MKKTDVDLDQKGELEYGIWSVLCRMSPRAINPVIRLSRVFFAEQYKHM